MAALVDRSRLVEVVDDRTRAMVDTIGIVGEASVLLGLHSEYYNLVAAEAESAFATGAQLVRCSPVLENLLCLGWPSRVVQ